jgi:uncharacterized protein (DUF58 family)
VRVKRCTWIIIAAFLLLFSSAIILDKPGLLATSLSIWVFLIWRYFIFFSRVKLVVGSIHTRRIIQKSLIRQGIVCIVTANITLEIEEGIRVLYTENIPVGTYVADGDVQTPTLSSGLHEYTLIYRITPIIHGNITFSGGVITVCDPFFETKMLLVKDPFKGPTLHVQPSPFIERNILKSQFGGIETNLIRIQHGYSVKMYRKYFPDDDIRNIDWKQSAKYDTLYVREYTSLDNNPPLIIIDLPDQDQEYDEKNHLTLVQAVSTRIENALKSGSKISLLIISGPNIISSLSDENDLNRYMTIIREWLHPHIRLHHLYRTKPRIEIRNELKNLQIQTKNDSESATSRHRSILIDIYKRHLLESGVNKFSSHISRILLSIKPDEITLFSLCNGDISHIREIAHQARFDQINFHIHTPLGRRSFELKPQCSALREESVEDIL